MPCSELVDEKGFRTLPDYLAEGLEVVFVGLNPGLSSAQAGHYFASPRNRFWPALNRSGLLTRRQVSGSDHEVLKQGLGFTDVVKRASGGASDLRAADFKRWAPVLREKLDRVGPLIVCFQGVTAYRNYLKFAEGLSVKPRLGLQPRTIGRSHVFVVPNPSPANAAYSLDDLVEWFRQLKRYRDELRNA